MEKNKEDVLVVSTEDMARICEGQWQEVAKEEGWADLPAPILFHLRSAFIKGFTRSLKVGHDLISGLVESNEIMGMQS